MEETQTTLEQRLARTLYLYGSPLTPQRFELAVAMESNETASISQSQVSNMSTETLRELELAAADAMSVVLARWMREQGMTSEGA